MTIRGPLSDQEENQFSSLRIGPACILVSTSRISQFLKSWRESEWSCPVDTPVADLEVSQEPVYQVERILKLRKVPGGRRGEKEVLVTWTDYPLEEAQWINEKNFSDPVGFRQQMRQDRPMEESSKPQQSTSLRNSRANFIKGGVLVVNA